MKKVKNANADPDDDFKSEDSKKKFKGSDQKSNIGKGSYKPNSVSDKKGIKNRKNKKPLATKIFQKK